MTRQWYEPRRNVNLTTRDKNFFQTNFFGLTFFLTSCLDRCFVRLMPMLRIKSRQCERDDSDEGR